MELADLVQYTGQNVETIKVFGSAGAGAFGGGLFGTLSEISTRFGSNKKTGMEEFFDLYTKIAKYWIPAVIGVMLTQPFDSNVLLEFTEFSSYALALRYSCEWTYNGVVKASQHIL